MLNQRKIVIPGDTLRPMSDDIRPGRGTYELHGKLHAALAGFVFIKKERVHDKMIEVIEVRRSEDQQDNVIPYIGGIVTARIVNIGQRFAKCELICVDDALLNSEFSAILRKEDIRLTERDSVDLPQFVQPGDIILARVISFGDNQTSFVLSIAEDELGVVSGVGENGERLYAMDWHIMQSRDGAVKETRKVAQVPRLDCDGSS